jgi:hypothetical protein
MSNQINSGCMCGYDETTKTCMRKCVFYENYQCRNAHTKNCKYRDCKLCLELYTCVCGYDDVMKTCTGRCAYFKYYRGGHNQHTKNCKYSECISCDFVNARRNYDQS